MSPTQKLTVGESAEVVPDGSNANQDGNENDSPREEKNSKKEVDVNQSGLVVEKRQKNGAKCQWPHSPKKKKTLSNAASKVYQSMPKQELAKFLDRHYEKVGPSPEGIKYEVDEIGRLLAAATESLQEQSTLVDIALGSGINIVGDVHGQFNDLVQIFLQLGRPPTQRYCVLGDFVDRGRRGIDCACLLLAYKTLYPTHVYVLRGNHELAHINKTYGFYDECLSRFGDKIGREVWLMFQRTFYHLPIFGLVEGRVLCMHGGLSPMFKDFTQLRMIKKPIKKPEALVNDGLWADPKYHGEGWLTNSRGTSFEFGPDIVESICERMGLDLIVRAHQDLMRPCDSDAKTKDGDKRKKKRSKQ